MGSISAIGGVYIRSENPERLNLWYKRVLGLGENGPVVRAYGVRPGETPPRNRNFIVTFCVADLDAAIADLRGQGVEVETYTGDAATGRCARLHDPDGNPVELWCEMATRAVAT